MIDPHQPIINFFTEHSAPFDWALGIGFVSLCIYAWFGEAR
jgi:hypothetical protein